jgi:hypothetical protein
VLAAKIMSLLAYLDDNGTHANKSSVCVAAGYYGGVHYWKRFNLDWDCAVKNRRLSELVMRRWAKPFLKLEVSNREPALTLWRSEMENSEKNATAESQVGRGKSRGQSHRSDSNLTPIGSGGSCNVINRRELRE